MVALRFTILFLPLLFWGCSSKEDKGNPGLEPSATGVLESYRDLTKATPEPVHVNPELAALCVGVWKQHLEAAEEKNGPHAHSSITIYLNELAAKAFEAGATVYPEGSVIVKEKSRFDYMEVIKDESGQIGPGNSVGPGAGETVKQEATTVEREDGVGGMIKRAAGSSSESGDWEFFYSSESGGLEAGTIASCVDCHSNAKERDWVFGDWKSPIGSQGNQG